MAVNPFSTQFSTQFGTGGSNALQVTQDAQTLAATGTVQVQVITSNSPFTADFSAAFGYGTGLSVTLLEIQDSNTLAAAGTVTAGMRLILGQDPNRLAAAGTAPLVGIGGSLTASQAPELLSATATSDIAVHVAGLSVTQDNQTLFNLAVIIAPPPTPETAIGQQSDMARRLAAVLPAGWFPDPDNTPVLNGVLAGIANMMAAVWSLLTYVSNQTRLGSATDINLDLISNDYLGTSLLRHQGESDTAYRARVKAAIFQQMDTRRAVSRNIQALTGTVPRIFEPANVRDTGAWNVASTLAYNVAGGWGSYALPFQCFIQTGSYAVQSTLAVQGYGTPSNPAAIVVGGYGLGSIDYSLGELELTAVVDEHVYDAVNLVKPVATVAWVSTQPLVVPNVIQVVPGPPKLDANFVLDQSRLG